EVLPLHGLHRWLPPVVVPDTARVPNGNLRKLAQASGVAVPSVVVTRMDVDAGNAGGAEHLGIAAVVLEGEAEVEAPGPELGHGVLLELPGHRIVAALAHEQGIPADAVAVHPGLGQGMHSGRTAGEEHDPERVFEEI